MVNPHPTLKERRSRAIVKVLMRDPEMHFSAKQIQDRIYDILKNSTPCTSSIGNLCAVLAAKGKLIRHETCTVSPEYTYQFKEAFA